MMPIDHDELLRLTRRVETPFYLYDGDFLLDHYDRLRKWTDDAITYYLSLKANNNVHIARLFRERGLGVEVASLGELTLAGHAGFPPEITIFSGPGKRRKELEAAIRQNIKCIIVESLDEIRLVDDIARDLETCARIAVRINPDRTFAKSAIRMGGVPRPFGIDESMLDEVLNLIEKSRHVHFYGIHVYIGTQILDPDTIVGSVAHTVELALRLSDRHGIVCRVVNLGGGFGVPYFPAEKPLIMDELLFRINEIVREAKRGGLAGAEFIIESGRYLLAQSGIYVTKVLYNKMSKGERFLVVDGGMHHHAGATFRGRAIRNNFPLGYIHPEGACPPEEKLSIVGPLCTPDDCLGKDVSFPSLPPGSIVYVMNSGAYGLSFSPTLFLGHATPMEILKKDGKYFVIRRPGKPEDLLLHQDFAPLENL